METVSNGALIYWEARGEGPPLVMLHGNGEDMSVFSAQVPEFSREFMVISIDSRGHGKSTAGGGKLSLYDMARDVVAVMDDAKIKKAHILGFSDGGNIGLIMAVKYPERVSSLVLTGANADPSGISSNTSSHVDERPALRAPFPRRPAVRRTFGPDDTSPGSTNGTCRASRFHSDTMGERHHKPDPWAVSAQQHIRSNLPFPRGHFTPVKLPEMYNKVVL